MWAMGYGMWYMGDEAESESESAYCVRVDNCRDDDGNDEGQWNRSIRIAVGAAESTQERLTLAGPRFLMIGTIVLAT